MHSPLGQCRKCFRPPRTFGRVSLSSMAISTIKAISLPGINLDQLCAAQVFVVHPDPAVSPSTAGPAVSRVFGAMRPPRPTRPPSPPPRLPSRVGRRAKTAILTLGLALAGVGLFRGLALDPPLAAGLAGALTMLPIRPPVLQQARPSQGFCLGPLPTGGPEDNITSTAASSFIAVDDPIST